VSQFPFVGPSYTARSRNLNAQRTLNLYREPGGPNGKSGSALIGTPGLRLLANMAGGGVRGELKFNASTLISVVGSNVYRLTTGWVPTLIGAIAGDTTPVSMASNGSVIMLVTGPLGYFIDPIAGTVTQITDPDFTGADVAIFAAGYFLWNDPGTGKLQWSQLLGTDIDALSFATAEKSPDNLVSVIESHGDLWLFGEAVTEIWMASTNPDQPFEPNKSAAVETGCAAKFSPAKCDNTVFWLTADDRGQGMVVRANGYSPARASDHALETAVAGYSRIDDAIGFSYQQEGHEFYVLTFPTADRTWVYDAATQEWHERCWRDADGGERRIRANCHAAFAGENVVGDWENGNLYAFDLDVFTDNGAAIKRQRRAPHIADGNYHNVVYDALQVDFEAGVGLLSGQGSDPQAMLRWSNDGAKTWSSEHWASIGKMGENVCRALWRKLGLGRDRVFEVTITDPVKVVMLGAAIQTRPCTS